MTETRLPEANGVQFEVLDGKRSSQSIGKHVFAQAVAATEQTLASRIESQGQWRKKYLGPVREVVELGARSSKNALRIAGDGLAAAHESFVFIRDGEQQPLVSALEKGSAAAIQTVQVTGEGERWTELSIPYRDKELRGNELVAQLHAWERAGIIEPSCRVAVDLVVHNPEWLDLSDVKFVMMGAASEMGPLEWLCRWGARVIAVDLPRPDLWRRIISVARQGAGTVSVPVRGGRSVSSDELEKSAGVDLLAETPDIRSWLSSFEGPLVVGNYAYADGSTFLRLAAALDALTAALQKERSDAALAYLATPTDAFAVPREVVDETRSRARRGLSAVARLASGGRVFQPNYDHVVEAEDGRLWGISDALVAQQGPNYALAKMLQRWRAIASRDDGHITSANVAPATLTRSVVKNKVLATAYRGASAFGVEVFTPETSRALMSALLVHDLRCPEASSRPEVELKHPYDLFCEGAAHGGLWRLSYQPRSVLPLAVGLGLVRRNQRA
jgi:hypothetical protein